MLDVAIAHKDYAGAGGPHRAIADLRLQLAAGETGALVGPSGCGKTTLLRMIAGLDARYEGRIALPDHGRLGVVFQEPRLLPWRSVIDNLRLCAPQASEERLQALLKDLGLADHAAHFPGELSLGLARRVALARALAVDPDLLLLDEPFASLDALLAQELRSMIARLLDATRVTSLIVTHDLKDAVALADKIFLLSPRPARVIATLAVATPRARQSAETAAELERCAREAIKAAWGGAAQ
jgi:ABC-type nitrate/sulfonate/bicarbonate transport system ATPase subunit